MSPHSDEEQSDSSLHTSRVRGCRWRISTHFSSIIPAPPCLTPCVLLVTAFSHSLTARTVCSHLGIIPEMSLLFIPLYRMHQKILPALSVESSWNLTYRHNFCCGQSTPEMHHLSSESLWQSPNCVPASTLVLCSLFFPKKPEQYF